MPAAPSTEAVTTGWQAVGGFFRVFDVAFFLPGAVLVLGLFVADCDMAKDVVENVRGILAVEQSRGVERADAQPRAPAAESADEDVPGWLAALALAIAFIVLVFVAGLLCHAVARVLRALMFRLGAWQWRRRGGQEESWFRHPYWVTTKALFSLKQDSRDAWGARVYGAAPATRERADPQLLLYFWNMATLCWNVAAAFVLVAVLLLITSSPMPGGALLSLAAALLLAMLGSEFRYFWETETRRAPAPAPPVTPPTPPEWGSP